MNKKRTIIIISLILGLVLVLFILLATRSAVPEDERPEYETARVDGDTGEVIIERPNVDPETQTGEGVVILGLTNFSRLGSAGLTNDQIPLFRDDIQDNALKQLPRHDSIVKILEPKYDYDKILITAKFKYREDSEPLLLEMNIENVYVFKYRLIRNGQTIYSSGRIISVDALGGDNYPGDGVPPELQP